MYSYNLLYRIIYTSLTFKKTPEWVDILITGERLPRSKSDVFIFLIHSTATEDYLIDFTENVIEEFLSSRSHSISLT